MTKDKNDRSAYYDSLPREVTMGVCPLTPQRMDEYETAAIRASERRRNQPGYEQPLLVQIWSKIRDLYKHCTDRYSGRIRR